MCATVKKKRSDGMQVEHLDGVEVVPGAVNALRLRRRRLCRRLGSLAGRGRLVQRRRRAVVVVVVVVVVAVVVLRLVVAAAVLLLIFVVVVVVLVASVLVRQRVGLALARLEELAPPGRL